MLEKENEEVVIEQRYVPANDNVLYHTIKKQYHIHLTVATSPSTTTTSHLLSSTLLYFHVLE